MWRPIPSHTLWQAPAAQPIVARIAVAGDFLPSGLLALPPGTSWRDMARRLAPLLADVDAGFANLETVLDSEGLSPRPLDGLGDIVAAPSEALEYLASLRFRFLSLANNHTFDFGAAGLATTRAALASRRLTPLGAGRTLGAGPEIAVWQGPGNLRVGFWAAAKATRDPSTRSFAGVEPATPSRAREAIAALRAQRVQFCLALVHAGCLRTSHPDPEDARLLAAVAAQGFDIVAASHSHRIAGARQVSASHGPSFCFCGLGSLVSGYISGPLEAEGLVVVAALDASGEIQHLEIRAVALGAGGWAEVPSNSGADRMFARFDSLSRQLADGSFARSFYREMSVGIVGIYWRDVRAALRHSGLPGLLRKAARLRLRHVKRLVRAVAG